MGLSFIQYVEIICGVVVVAYVAYIAYTLGWFNSDDE